ncbi:lysin A [Rhodococcus phage MacGully]|nr:lysin A [Rhodococcus phage MacGully]
MADPTWLPDELKRWGLKVEYIGDPMNDGHGDFRQCLGVIGHHTAGGGSNDWRIVKYGRPDLPGPLAQLVLEKDGSVKFIAIGVCWHAGRGRWKSKRPNPGIRDNDANWYTIGVEAVSRGTPDAQGRFDWTDAQIRSYKLIVAAICSKIGKHVDEGFLGHKEYSSEGKIDPAGIDLDAFRRDVQALIDNPPWKAGTPVANENKEIGEIHFQIAQPHKVREAFQKVFYNIKDGNFWLRAGLADIWNEVVWDGYVNPVDLLDGKPDPDKAPKDTPLEKLARRGSLVSYVLATYREATLARREAEAARKDIVALTEKVNAIAAKV